MIYLWDKESGFLLVPRHNPLVIGTGEPGMADKIYISPITTPSPTRSPVKRKAARDTVGLDMMINSVVDVCKVNSSTVSKSDMKDDYDKLVLQKIYQ